MMDVHPSGLTPLRDAVDRVRTAGVPYATALKQTAAEIDAFTKPASRIGSLVGMRSASSAFALVTKNLRAAHQGIGRISIVDAAHAVAMLSALDEIAGQTAQYRDVLTGAAADLTAEIQRATNAGVITDKTGSELRTAMVQLRRPVDVPIDYRVGEGVHDSSGATPYRREPLELLTARWSARQYATTMDGAATNPGPLDGVPKRRQALEYGQLRRGMRAWADHARERGTAIADAPAALDTILDGSGRQDRSIVHTDRVVAEASAEARARMLHAITAGQLAGVVAITERDVDHAALELPYVDPAASARQLGLEQG